ncbi:hypothetical protein F7C95_17635 [Opitutia bacterium ISCC 51]|nr:hypothetical protein F7C95_17635 [Opitutae bacterium ISCC 51]QXD27794.1 hypothetical protein GA003_17540 [Opitutae bacterium ISCC 52]
MIADLRKLYKKTSTREKFLLLLFIGAIAIVWMSYSFSRYNTGFKLLFGTQTQIEAYEMILSQKDYVETQLIEKSSELDSSKTLSSTELLGRISELIKPMDIENYTINSPQTESGALFTFHNIRLSVNRADKEEVLRLSEKLKTLVPYVTLDRITMNSDRSDSNLMNVQFFISSLEMSASP